MGKNPLDDATAGGSGGNGPMKPGDVRVIKVKDREGKTTKTITVHRTDRPYAEDLCDAYNAARTRDDIIWIVDNGGNLRLVDTAEREAWRTAALARRAESERQEWLRNHNQRDFHQGEAK